MTLLADLTAAPSTVDGNELIYTRLPSGDDPNRKRALSSLVEYFRGSLGYGLRNLFHNPDFAINQRSFAGGTLSAGTYGFDRWKAGASAAVISRASTGIVTLLGPIVQVIKAPGLAGQAVTISVDTPSAAIDVVVSDGGANTATGTIAAGSGRKSVTVTVPSAATGNVTCQLSTSASTTFKSAQFETGSTATQFDLRPLELEALLCQRYYQTGSGEAWWYGDTAAAKGVMVALSPRMQAAPTLSVTKTGGVNCGDLAIAALGNAAAKVTTTVTALGDADAQFTWTATAEL